MIPKLAILQCADTGPLESLVVMLRSIGVDCALPDRALRDALRSQGCDNVSEIQDLVDNWGYDPPFPEAPLPEAGTADMSRADVLYVDVKSHRNGPKVVNRWPNLANRVLWYRINGGKPEHVVNARGDQGDEVNPGCPVLTPNQWYRKLLIEQEQMTDANEMLLDIDGLWPWRSYYACWPPFVRFDGYRRAGIDGAPICLVHNVVGWGYGPLTDKFREHLGVKVYGRGSPDGLISHQEAKGKLETALAYVHLKSSDAPGYALYEALASACPVVCTRRLIWRMRMQDLLIPGETCLVFDRETHDGLTPQDVTECAEEVTRHLKRLSIQRENEQIGRAGRERLQSVMWDAGKAADVESLRDFFARNFR